MRSSSLEGFASEAEVGLEQRSGSCARYHGDRSASVVMMQVRCSDSSGCRSCCPARRTPAASSTDPRCARAGRGPRCVSAGVSSVSPSLSVSVSVCQCLCLRVCLSLTLRCVPGCEGRSLSSASAAAGPALGKRLECMASRSNIQRVRVCLHASSTYSLDNLLVIIFRLQVTF